jgi:hypothetical protein
MAYRAGHAISLGPLCVPTSEPNRPARGVSTLNGCYVSGGIA